MYVVQKSSMKVNLIAIKSLNRRRGRKRASIIMGKISGHITIHYAQNHLRFDTDTWPECERVEFVRFLFFNFNNAFGV